MHASIWTYTGDPDDLAARYQALVDEVPVENMRFSAAVRTPDGLVMLDTCPSKEVFDAFVGSDGFQDLLRRHGLDRPESVVDCPVVRAYAGGQRVDATP